MAVTPADIQGLSDDDLAALQSACLSESSRRAALKSLPTQAVSVAYQYKRLGGDPAIMVAAVQSWIDDQEDTP